MIVWDGGWLTFFSLSGDNRRLPQHRRDGFSPITITPNGVGKPKLQWTKADEIDYHSMRFQFWSMSEDSRVGILLRDSSVLSNQGCCSSGQYNLPDKILRLDANTTLNQSYVLFITLVNIAYQSRDQYLPFIHSWDRNAWWVLYISLFLIIFLLFSRPLF